MVFGIQEYEAEEEGSGYDTGGEDGRVDVGERVDNCMIA